MQDPPPAAGRMSGRILLYRSAVLRSVLLYGNEGSHREKRLRRQSAAFGIFRKRRAVWANILEQMDSEGRPIRC